MFALIPADAAVVISVKTCRCAARINLAALRTTLLPATLPAWPINPIRLILSGGLFNQDQKFFVAGWAEKWRFSHILPPHSGLRGHKFAQLT